MQKRRDGAAEAGHGCTTRSLPSQVRSSRLPLVAPDESYVLKRASACRQHGGEGPEPPSRRRQEAGRQAQVHIHK